MIGSWRMDGRGNVAVIFAMLMVPTLASVGLALDHVRLSATKTAMQAEADAAALSRRDGAWISDTEYRVQYSRQVQTAIMSIIGVDVVEIDVEAVALFKPLDWVQDLPEILQLDESAGDYNRISLYCYNSVTGIRTSMAEVADNRDGSYDYEMPQCNGSAVQLMLYNDWAGGNWWYTDSGAHGRESAWELDLIETMRCDTVEQCRPVSEGGIVPEGAERDPVLDKRPCAEGKYIYYGWEDTPDFDRDFNDIRIVVKCPAKSAEKIPLRLVR